MSLKRKGIRENIIKTSSKIFAKYGFRKTTMNDIAKEMEMGKSSLYYYFKSKEKVFEAVVLSEAEILRTVLEKDIINKDIEHLEKIRRYVITRMQYLNNLVNFYSTLKNDYLGNIAFTERIRTRYDKEERETIQKFLEQGLKKGIFKIKETKVTAIALVTALKGLETALLINEDINDSEIENYLNDVLDILFYGLVK
ncbi:MAG: TetR/AcrR family transcriptional regulator [Bacteroidales bacterium]|jgi:AcrR family transcriptional regulator|nr:TetR/AcrR family transcriptional regulator [Bacteroidales bacterium]